MSETLDKAQIKRIFGKALAEAQLETAYDKFVVLGFNQDEGPDMFTNCTNEQVLLLLEVIKKAYGPSESNGDL
jgi:hypothetical protein